MLRGFNTTLDTMMCAITVLTCNFLRCILFAAQGNAEAVAGQVHKNIVDKTDKSAACANACVYVCVCVCVCHVASYQ